MRGSRLFQQILGSYTSLVMGTEFSLIDTLQTCMTKLLRILVRD
jgi:hypothetical protein